MAVLQQTSGYDVRSHRTYKIALERGRGTFNGKYYGTRKVRLYTIPRRRIPIYISLLVPNSSLVAGYYGDGLISVANPAVVVKAIIANFKAGKNHEKMPKQVEITVAYTDDVDAAVKIFKQH